VLDVSRLGCAGQMLSEAGTAEFQEVLDGCEPGNPSKVSGVLMIRSQLACEILDPSVGEVSPHSRWPWPSVLGTLLNWRNARLLVDLPPAFLADLSFSLAAGGDRHG
jgi:hypothetical protein